MRCLPIQNPQQRAPTPPPTGRIEGTVLRTNSNELLGGARFSMRGLAPGDYKLFAWETLESFAYFDPELLKPSESQAKAVHIVESSKLNFEIHAIH